MTWYDLAHKDYSTSTTQLGSETAASTAAITAASILLQYDYIAPSEMVIAARYADEWVPALRMVSSLPFWDGRRKTNNHMVQRRPRRPRRRRPFISFFPTSCLSGKP